jgi:anti-sigma B factor antagonist
MIAAMTWTEAGTADVHIVRLSGEIDLQHSPKLRQLLQGKAAARPRALLLDFSDVRYIDSSGLATLVEYYKNSRAYSGRLAVAGLSNRVKSIFDLVRLGEVFGVYGSLAEAEAALRGAMKS